jgi:hypothetical protein
MDRASEKLSRARAALNVAMMAGMEAQRGELFDIIAIAIEQIDSAETALSEGENRAALPGQLAPAGLELVQPTSLELVQTQPKSVSVLTGGLAGCQKLAVGLFLAASFTPSNLYTV